jgi:hypothetical protein
VRRDEPGAVERLGAAGVAWYLRMVPWAVPGFDVTVHRRVLETAAARDLVVYQERLLLVGRRC